MSGLSDLFSKLDERYGLPTALLAVVGFAAFLLALKDGYHLTNATLMVSGALLSIASGLYCWRHRYQSSVSYVGEAKSLAARMKEMPLISLVCVIFCFSVAAFFAYAAYTGGRLPWEMTA